MKFTQLPQAQDSVLKTLTDRGYEYTEDLESADFLVFSGSPEDFPQPLPGNIQFVQLQFAGVDALADAGLLTDDVRWANAAGIYDDTVAESAMALLLAVGHQHKKVADARSWSVRNEVEANTRYLFRDMTVAIIGAGGIGRRLIELLKPFKARVVAVNRSGNPVEGAEETFAIEKADQVWEQADAFILLMPLTEETRHMVDRELLKKMKNTAVVINVGRGPLVDTDALVEALESGEIAGAGLDVTDPEPLPDGHRLWELDNVSITPHTANTSWYIEEKLGELAADSADAFARGEKMPTEVDVSKGY